jgi:aryl-phospho-beta-D-glucosidase BglC (GH1 family)
MNNFIFTKRNTEKKHLLLLIACLFIIICQNVQGEGFLKVKGVQIIDGNGKETILRGINLGGWMLQEGYMLQINRGVQHQIKAQITDLAGKENCDHFYDLWLQNYTTKTDIDSIARWGFNSVRMVLHYNLFTLPIEDEPVEGEHTWLAKGFEMTDSLLSWCKANNIYVIFDLHAAPGGQGKQPTISDYDPGKPSLWESDLNKQKTIAFWKKLAGRYAAEPLIAGYDLLNEPNWSFEGKEQHGSEDTLNKPLWDLYRDITKAIREVDKNHIIFIEGNYYSSNYNGFEGAWDDNMALSFHKYWNPNDIHHISKILNLRTKFNLPLWLGESGENSNKWFTECIELLENQSIGWCWWPLKKIGSVSCPLTVVPPKEYQQLTDYWNRKAEKPSKELATETLFKLAENLKTENSQYNKDVIDAMFRQRNETVAIPYSPHKAPGRIYASDFDLGRAGVAYSDTDEENSSYSPKNEGNKGKQYRNDGVDIRFSTDAPAMTNGYQVTGTEKGEWLQYTIHADKSGTHNVSVRVAGGKGAVRLLCFRDTPPDNEVRPLVTTGAVTIPAAKDENTWQTLSLGKINLSEGKNVLRLLIDEGGFELGFIDIN